MRRPANRSVKSAGSNNWEELCARYLPIVSLNSIWRFSRQQLETDPDQGWKLHVSATVLSAARVMRAVAPFLHRREILFKGPNSLQELDRLNSGIFYGYSQIGKFLTIYPRTTDEAVALAQDLHRLTRGIPAPSVPFDFRFASHGCVYYRYGGFKEIQDPSGEHEFALRDPNGNFIADVRDVRAAPDWAPDPFKHRPQRSRPSEPPEKIPFKAFRALGQRGRGGVYQAIDLSVEPARLCILKQGRKLGELSWDGRDGFWRVRHEGKVLSSLQDSGVKVPRVCSSFSTHKSYYIAIEFIQGETLEQWLTRRRRRLPLTGALERSIEISKLISSIHAAGWVWRDCKPRNIILSSSGELRPLDFEGACPIKKPDPLPWGTSSYISPEASAKFEGRSRLPEDLYALGVVIYLLLSGRTPDHVDSQPLGKSRRNIPSTVTKIVMDLLDSNPAKRPQAATVATSLKAALLKFSREKYQGKSPTRRARSLNRASLRKSS
ncbi:MAG: hypothetical protein DMF72_20675 [Acidobacteria bacterium]|nr:MAG: hypothetical protein DMF72_20675 [Acidobacteriota bacterium]